MASRTSKTGTVTMSPSFPPSLRDCLVSKAFSSSQPESQQRYGDKYSQHGPVEPVGLEFVQHVHFTLKTTRTHGQVNIAAELNGPGHQHARAGRGRPSLLPAVEMADHPALSGHEHVVRVSQKQKNIAIR